MTGRPVLILPKTGPEVRIGPRYNGTSAAHLWKFWVSGSEVYAATRNAGHLMKVSLHASGQVHLRHGSRDLQLLAPVVPIGGGAWRHGLEIRFLLSDDARTPPPEKLGKKSALLIDVPSDAVLLLNLFVEASVGSGASGIPQEMTGGETIWRRRLRDRREAVLVARVQEMNDDNRRGLRFIR